MKIGYGGELKGMRIFQWKKKFLSETKDGVVNQSWWPYEFAGSTRNANAEIKKLFDGKKPFDTPKPTQLIKRVIDMCTSKDSVVLDFFCWFEHDGSVCNGVQYKR